MPFLGIHKWDFRCSGAGARRLTCRSSRLFHLHGECSGYPLARSLATQCYVGLHLMNKELQRKPVKETLLCVQN
jgi:hypothetical protein